MNLTNTLQSLAVAAIILITQPSHADTYYFHNDHLGTPQALTDDTGTVVWQGNYSPFGEATETTDTVEQNIRFPGQYFEEETGLHYNYYRDYDPSTGRYIESDPIGLGGGINSYVYVLLNPILWTDPLGKAPIKIRTAEWGHGGSTSGIEDYLPNDTEDEDTNEMCGSGDDCYEEIRSAELFCKALSINSERFGPMRGLWGGSYASCVLGQVSWLCMDYI